MAGSFTVTHFHTEAKLVFERRIGKKPYCEWGEGESLTV